MASLPTPTPSPAPPPALPTDPTATGAPVRPATPEPAHLTQYGMRSHGAPAGPTASPAGGPAAPGAEAPSVGTEGFDQKYRIREQRDPEARSIPTGSEPEGAADGAGTAPAPD